METQNKMTNKRIINIIPISMSEQENNIYVQKKQLLMAYYGELTDNEAILTMIGCGTEPIIKEQTK